MVLLSSVERAETRRLAWVLVGVIAAVGLVLMLDEARRPDGLDRCKLAPRAWVTGLSDRLGVPLAGGWMVRTEDPDLEEWWFLSADAYGSELSDESGRTSEVATWATAGVTEEMMDDGFANPDDLANLVNLTFPVDDLARMIGAPGTVEPPPYGLTGIEGAELSRRCMERHRP